MDLIIGQTWRDKDKRRPKQGTLMDFTPEIVTIDFGKGISKEYARHRFEQRWEPIIDAVREVKHQTREEWLTEAIVQLISRVFTPDKVETDVPQTRVSVGWPGGGRGPKKNTIGQCFATKTTDDKVAQIFISPVLDDPKIVLATLAHELVHAIDDCESGHKKGFITIARAVGLTGKWTATVAGEELAPVLAEIADELGGYPHSAIRPTERPVIQKTYMKKLVSVNEPDFFVRMTIGKLEEFGAPRDPWGDEMELED